MDFFVRSRGEMEYLQNDVCVPHAIISITNPGSAPAKVKQNDCTLGLLRLEFDDTEEDPLANADMYRRKMYVQAFGKPKVFSRRQAQSISNFVEHLQPDAVIVHCEAGISRSAAVAAALSLHYNGTDGWVWQSGRYNPNKLVYRILVEVLCG